MIYRETAREREMGENPGRTREDLFSIVTLEAARIPLVGRDYQDS